MGHEGETQTHSDDVPNTIRRGANYYYKRRIPTPLVRAQAFGLKKSGKPVDFLCYSLKTSDPRLARRRAAFEDAEAERKFRTAELKLSNCRDAKFANVGETRLRELDSLSDAERRELIARHFIMLEKARDRLALVEMDSVEREWAAQTVIEDLGHFQRPDPGGDWRYWDRTIADLLLENGIEGTASESRNYRDLKDLFRRSYIAHYSRTLQLIKGGLYHDVDPFFRNYDAETSFSNASKEAGVTIARLCSAFLESKLKSVAQASLDKYPMQFRALKDFFGEDRRIATLSVEEAQAFAKFLGELPLNATKRYRNVSLKEAAEKESKLRHPLRISAKTHGLMFAGISGIFRYAVELEWLDRNPFGKRVVADQIPHAEKRDKPMMTAAEMNRLFSSKDFLRERNAGERGEARFWVPLLCLLLGTRTNEVCQLLVDDIAEENGIHYFHIRETDEAGDAVKRLKTSASRRIVPLHSELIRMGFLDFVDARRATGGRVLFPELEANRRGSKADSTGKWFGRLRKRLFPDLPDIRGAKGLHSLRHSFTKAAELGGIDEKTLWKLGGWSSGKARNSATAYGTARDLSELKAAIDKIRYHEVDFSHLYPGRISSSAIHSAEKGLRASTRNRSNTA